MTSLRRTGGPLALVLLLLWGAALAAEPFPLEALQSGLRGYGVTAGAGNALERFDVEVLALQRDLGLGFPVVLVRTSGTIIDDAGGVAAGMSGSPVYLPGVAGDRLLGAIGFTFPNSDAKLALVTPIEVMRRSEPRTQLEEFGHEHVAALGAPAPVRTPLLVSGAGSRTLERLGRLLDGSPLALQPIASGGARATDDDAYALEPGSAVSVQLVRGDVTIAAIGTLTLLDGDSFWAFGHPLLGRGSATFALAPAYVTYIVPHRTVPFKLADSGSRVLGVVREDRPFAVAGRTGADASFLPVTLTLNAGSRSTVKRLEVSPDEELVAPLVALATLQVLDEALEAVRGGSARLAWELEVRGGERVRVLEQIVDRHDVSAAVARLAAEPLEVLARNAFEAPNLARVHVLVDLEDEQQVAEIVETVPERERVRPGEALTVFVRLQPFRGEPEVRTVRVPLPDDLEGPLDIVFRGGREPSLEEGEPLLSFAELLLALGEHVQSSELVVEITEGASTRRLERIPLPYVVRGSRSLSVRVEGDDVIVEELPAAAAPDAPLRWPGGEPRAPEGDDD